MKQLSGLDAIFLHLETPEMPMHVGGLNLFDLPPGHRGDFYEEVKAHIVSRMHLAGIFTKKLALMPFDLANPVWVKDRDVDIDYHIRKITLPKPGTVTQLETYVARLHSSLLDRSRPLWEFYVFDGMKSGQAAFYSKIHHSALDGQGGEALARAMLDFTPIPRPVQKPEADDSPSEQPSVNELLVAALRDNVAQSWKLVKLLPAMAKAAGEALLTDKGEDGKRRLGLPRNFLAPRTPFNVSITNQRIFAGLSVSMSEAKEIAKAFDGSLNDVVMAMCSGALRRYLEGRDALPERSLVGAVPVSLREEGNTEQNNQVSMMLLNLATDRADPKKRMREIVKFSRSMKETLKSVKSVLPTDYPSLGSPWLISGLASLYGRSKLADKLPPLASVAISNVPGSPVPLYLAGARMRTYFPVSIVTHGIALNITVQSYDGALDFGLIACRRAVPDLRDFAKMMSESHHELLHAARELVSRPVLKPFLKPVSKAVPKAAVKPKAKAATKAVVRAATKPAAKARAKPVSNGLAKPKKLPLEPIRGGSGKETAPAVESPSNMVRPVAKQARAKKPSSSVI